MPAKNKPVKSTSQNSTKALIRKVMPKSNCKGCARRRKKLRTVIRKIWRKSKWKKRSKRTRS